MELALEEALTAVDRGEIVDAKTIMLLQHLALHELTEQRTTVPGRQGAVPRPPRVLPI